MAAHHHGVAVERLSLAVQHGRRDRPRLAPLAVYVKSRRNAGDPLQACADYALVLLASSAARFVGLEAHLGYPRPHVDLSRLLRGHLAEAALCVEPETDRAFSIIVGRLAPLDEGDAQATFNNLWRRALQLLKQPPHRQRLDRIAAELQRRRVLEGDDLAEVLAQ